MTAVPGLDAAALTAWLAERHPDLAAGPLTATVIAGGRSNLTYAIEGARLPLVLRRPPLGHVLSSAHDMRREHRVISALGATAVPVPRAVDVVDDTVYHEAVKFAAAVQADPDHPARRAIDRYLERLADNLQHDPTTIGRLEDAKSSVFDSPRVRELAAEAWNTAKAGLLTALGDDEPLLAQAAQRGAQLAAQISFAIHCDTAPTAVGDGATRTRSANRSSDDDGGFSNSVVTTAQRAASRSRASGSS